MGGGGGVVPDQPAQSDLDPHFLSKSYYNISPDDKSRRFFVVVNSPVRVVQLICA